MGCGSSAWPRVTYHAEMETKPSPKTVGCFFHFILVRDTHYYLPLLARWLVGKDTRISPCIHPPPAVSIPYRPRPACPDDCCTHTRSSTGYFTRFQNPSGVESGHAPARIPPPSAFPRLSFCFSQTVGRSMRTEWLRNKPPISPSG